MNIKLTDRVNKSNPIVFLFKKEEDALSFLSVSEKKFFLKEAKKDKSCIDLSNLSSSKFLIKVGKRGNENKEKLRQAAVQIGNKIEGKVQVKGGDKQSVLSFCEGLILNHYTFDKYLSGKSKGDIDVALVDSTVKPKEVKELTKTLSATLKARDWVNEPVNKLTTEAYLKEIKNLKKSGASVEVFRKSKIQSLNMGGILAVNQGSYDEPALAIIEWKPKQVKNSKPVVLVGKGILFDTGGINIKTGDFMTDMKADMGGSAAVIGATKAIIENELPVHLITIVPITENRINGKEIVPGDVIKMHNGKSVEVLNTDAEGRLVLGDALSFAKKYKPELVIDAATLTGSAFRTSSHHGGVVMGTDQKAISAFKEAGEKVYERLVELPMWGEFEESLNSSVADINNLGAGPGQAVCAGFFLKNFIDYPWVHLDIAGPAFIPSKMTYREKGGTGFGVRLIYQFIKDRFEIK